MHEPEEQADPWSIEELPEVAEPEPAPVSAEPEPEPEPAPEPEAVDPDPDPDLDPEPEPVEAVEAEPEREPVLLAVSAEQALAPRAQRLARHRLDPFTEEAARRWPWQRRGEDTPADAELPSLPQHTRILVREQNGAGR